MTARNYDVTLQVQNASSFTTTSILVGNTTQTVGYISGVDTVANLLKVRLANLLQEYALGEYVHVNVAVISGTANGAINNNTALPFVANTQSSNTTIAISNIQSITPSAFIAEKNAFTQNPVVRLYSIYYPGEWYPPNEAGNPTGPGLGRAWPTDFPIRFAEIVGDTADDLQYTVTHSGISYQPYPVAITGVEQSNDGKINELSVSLFNVDNLISRLVEDPYLVGNNISNSVVAYVNGEAVHGIDPRTVDADPADVGVPGDEAYDTLTRARANGLLYSTDIVAAYGQANASFNREQAESIGGTWKSQRSDSRDLLGGVVEIKTTFANFLDYWPEYSRIVTSASNTIQVKNIGPYRVGDQIYANAVNTSNIYIVDITTDNMLVTDTTSTYYSNTTFDASIQAIWISPQSNLIYGIGAGNDRIYYGNVSSGDIRTLDYKASETAKTLFVRAYEGTPRGLAITPAGDRVYVAGSANDAILYYQLSSKWNVGSASLVSVANLNSTLGQTDPQGIDISPDGTKFFVLGSAPDVIYECNLTTAYDTSTLVNVRSVSIGAQTTAPQDIRLSSAGDKLYLLGTATLASGYQIGANVYTYTLEEPYSLANITYESTYVLPNVLKNTAAFAFSADGYNLYVGETTEDKIYQVPLNEAWNVNSAYSAGMSAGSALLIHNEDADADSYIQDRFRINQLESLTDHVATFGLVSWLQYFKMIVPRRKYYKNTCQWVYKGEECQYPGPGGLPIPGTTLTSNTYAIGSDNRIATIRSASLITTSSWVAGTEAPVDYVFNGDGNSLMLDSTPYGDLNIVWDISNQDAASDADGGWNTSRFPVDHTKLYRFSVWVRRKTIGNGSTYFGPRAYDLTSVIDVYARLTGTASSNPYFYVDTWDYEPDDWVLLVAHVWPSTSGTGDYHVDTGLYSTSGEKIGSCVDYIWQNTTIDAIHRTYLFYSTNTTTNQQMYDPRVDLVDGNEPTISELITYSSAQLAARTGDDICAKSFAACTARNNEIHFGGFIGVGRTVPRA